MMRIRCKLAPHLRMVLGDGTMCVAFSGWYQGKEATPQQVQAMTNDLMNIVELM